MFLLIFFLKKSLIKCTNIEKLENFILDLIVKIQNRIFHSFLIHEYQMANLTFVEMFDNLRICHNHESINF